MSRKTVCTKEINPAKLAEEYSNADTPVREIKAKYGLSNYMLYDILAKYYGSRDKIPSRKGKREKLEEITTAAPVVETTIKTTEPNKNEDFEQLLDEALANYFNVDGTEKDLTEEYEDEEAHEEQKGVEEMVELEFAGSKFTDPAISRLYDTNTVEVNMISDRHDTGTYKSIFTGPLSDDQICDYRWQENVIRRFIESNLTLGEEGYEETLSVICSGLQMILASLLKVCYEKGVKLNLKHWNPTKEVYDTQKIITDRTPGLDKFSRLNGEIYLYNCTVKDITDLIDTNPDIELPCVILNDHDENNTYTKTTYIICLDKKHMWDMYIKATEAMMEVQTKHSVSACNLIVNKFGNLSIGNKISRGYNFSTQQYNK